MIMNAEQEILIQASHSFPDKNHLRFYRGKSMNGTFRPGDCLMMKPITLQAVRSGDVVIFRKLKWQGLASGKFQDDEDPLAGEVHVMEESQPVDELVHRVVAIRLEGLITRGDNNPYSDAELVNEDNLIGLVTHLERGSKLRTVHGGWIGLLKAWLLRTWKQYLWNHIVRKVSRPYHWLNDKGWVAKFWHPDIVKVRLTSDDGPLIKYIFHSRTIARWWPLQDRFECRKPYDLVLRR
jgi:signal peptidase I